MPKHTPDAQHHEALRPLHETNLAVLAQTLGPRPHIADHERPCQGKEEDRADQPGLDADQIHGDAKIEEDLRVPICGGIEKCPEFRLAPSLPCNLSIEDVACASNEDEQRSPPEAPGGKRSGGHQVQEETQKGQPIRPEAHPDEEAGQGAKDGIRQVL